jgi:nuclear pore complex protein Nup107
MDFDDDQPGHEGADNRNSFLYAQHDRMDLDVHGESSMLIDTTDAQSPFRSSAQEMLRPLQDTADRVSRQVEEFAKALDKFDSTRNANDETLWEDALVLLERYSKIAETRKSKTPDAEGEEELDKLQLEGDMWILLRNLLATKSPRNVNDVQIAQESSLGGLHRYSSNTQLWTAFLDSDPVAQEYEHILSWLQERAAENSPPIEDVVRYLTSKSSRGDGISSSGPMFTQAKIKGQKRTRLWSMPLEPSNPGLSRTHIRESDQAPLIAQLDPDACLRESAVLEYEDEYYEQAAWQTYWEMLRRGSSNPEIRAWFAERKMSWRYAALCGCGTAIGQMADSPWVRMLNLATNSEWLTHCRQLAQNPAIDDRFQKAVYGVLCGNVDASTAANDTIEDHLFCLFNSLLIQRYQHYLQAFRETPVASTYQPPFPDTDTIRHYIRVAVSDPELNNEYQLPHRLMEMAVMGKNIEDFLLNMGRAAAKITHSGGQNSDLMKQSAADVDQITLWTAQDHDSVRMATHLQLLLQPLGLLDSVYAQNEYELENNIAAYIGLLESLGRWLLIPVYASKLSKKRSYHVLGSILINVTDRRERDLQVKLMKQYRIDVSETVYSVFSIANFDRLQKLRAYKRGPISGRITVLGGPAKTAQHKIRPALMVGDLSEADERSIRSVEWVRYVQAEKWPMAAWSVAALYKIFLVEGNFVALRQLMERVGLSEMSLAAIGMNLHFADTEPSPNNIESEEDEDRIQPMTSPSRRRKAPSVDHSRTRAGTDRQTLAFRSLSWKQLEQLVAAIDALDAFQEVADSLEQ